MTEDGAARAAELREQAEATRRLIARFDVDLVGDERRDLVAWQAMVNRALLVTLKNQQAILEALANVPQPTASVAAAAPSAPPALPEPEPASAHVTIAIDAPLSAPDGAVTGPRARRVVSEFDQRDKDFQRGLDKLNQWLSAGRAGLPFQKREDHAYLNTGANTDAMISRIESELMGREGFTLRLGRLVIEGLVGEVLIYARSPGAN